LGNTPNENSLRVCSILIDSLPCRFGKRGMINDSALTEASA
jgi:hypothetical protein